MNISDALFTGIGFFSLVFLVTIFYIKAYKTLCKNIVETNYPTSSVISSGRSMHAVSIKCPFCDSFDIKGNYFPDPDVVHFQCPDCDNCFFLDDIYPTSPATSSEPVPQRGGVSGNTGHDNSQSNKLGDSITPDVSCRASGYEFCPADSIVTCSQSDRQGDNRRASGSSRGNGTHE